MVQIFLDTETTGVEIGACVIELAAIMVDDGEIVEIFHEYAKPYRTINPNAQKAHGISMEFLKDKPEEKEMLERFREWLLGSGAQEVLAYNAQFDIRIINDRMIMDNIIETKIFDNYRVTDVARMAKEALRRELIPKKGRSWNQEYVASCFGIKYDAHAAIEDVKAMYQVYLKLKEVL